MANRTVKDAKNIHGTNPQYLIEKIIRSRIYDSKFWKEQCFALTAELLVDKAMEIRYTGGVFGSNIRPTPFLCLTLKMLQIQPEKDIVVEFIKNEEFKYVRALGAFYLRLTGTSVDCYKYLEPLYNDNRKLRHQNRAGNYEIIHMDEFIDQLLRDDRVCDIIMPRVQKRHILEENNELEPKVSALDDDLDDEGSDDEPNPEDEISEELYDTKKKHKRDSDRRDERKETDRRESDRRESDRRYDRKYDDKDRKSDKYSDKYSRDRDYERSRYESNRRDERNDRNDRSDRKRDRDYDRDRSDRKRHRDDDYEYKRRH
ncbi:pre-mRNA-splicing factor 38 [Sitodiplosis mosellana]|uniref:pre-mRNA-splicing factor 38 n=1 Tax=Sitodiplosis mosellana TaxID=263140 RepID=UPI002443C248|nr:pre-mRNA-splicing factor 38 [Sitodiplosis mosellana]